MPDSLAARIATEPLPADARAARRDWSAWLRGLPPEAAEALAATIVAHPRVEALLRGAFDGSPFLKDMAGRDPARLVRLLSTPPESSLERLLAGVAALAGTADDDDATLKRALRVAKQELALLVALADLGGAWTVSEVTAALSAFAERAVRSALAVLLSREAVRGRIVLADAADPEKGCGFFVLGMGKLGAGELNYSSDIDLVCFYDRDAARLADAGEHQAFFVRVTQALARLIGDRTYDGVVFRVDLRLRPDPGTYPVAISTVLALHYYEALGQTWERAAFIKARPVAGDRAVGDAFLAELRPFVFRRHLDYASIAEVHAMKRQIQAVKGQEAAAVPGLNVKLGPGGIREIEFFVQTQQLIGGGRNPALRRRGTVETLAALEAAGWIRGAVRSDLVAAYHELRRIEHRLQMVADEQTHTLPAGEDELARFARFAGFRSAAGLKKKLAAVLPAVRKHYARLFEGEVSAAAGQPFDPAVDGPETRTGLASMGFADPAVAVATVHRWLAGTMPATRSAVARERLGEILPRLLAACGATGQADETLRGFDLFLSAQPAGVQLFSLLRSNPNLIDLFAAILGTAPRLAESLRRRPRLLEALLETLHAPAALRSQDPDARLDAALADTSDLEEALDRTRIAAQDMIFATGTGLVGGVLPFEGAGPRYSAVASAVVDRLRWRVEAEHVRRFGRTPRDACAVVAFGKLGSAEMTAASDLDLVLLYGDAFDAMSDGPKPLAATEYYTRLTQRLIAALTAQTAEGSIYAVDMRLRPSGNKGPLATSLASFRAYHADEAWTWEHMALTRARVVSAPDGFGAEVTGIIDGIVRRPRNGAKLTADIVDMRRILWREKPPADAWDVKLVAGGLVDLEFLCQWLALRHAHAHPAIHARSVAATLQAARVAGVIAAAQADALIAAARFHGALSQVLRLCLNHAFDPGQASRGLAVLVARAVEEPDLRRVEGEFARHCGQVARIAREWWRADPFRD